MWPSASDLHPDAVAQALALEAELARVCRCLSDASIPVIVLKGVPLARRLHGRLGLRKSVDNDLLVREADVVVAVNALRGLGYRDLDSRSLSASRAFTFQHPMGYSAPAGRLFVEVHWSAFTPDLFAVSPSLQWSRTEAFVVREAPVLVFDRAMTLVHLAAHAAQHYLTEPRILRDIAEAWALWRNELEMGDLVALADRTQTREVLAWALQASGAAPGALETPRTRWFAAVAHPKWLSQPTRARLYCGMLLAGTMVRPSRLPRALLRAAFPPPAQMDLIYRQALPRRRWLRYAGRPFRPLARLLRGRAASER